MDAPSEPDIPPWDEADAVRRDCEPHRGGLLHVLSVVALLTGAFSLLCVPLGFIGLPLGMLVWVWARRDLVEIRAGIMEPEGERLTAEALYFAQGGTLAGVLGLVLWGYILSVAL